MATINQIQDLADSLPLPHYPVVNTSGQIIKGALAIVGVETIREMQLMAEFINLQSQLAAEMRIFERFPYQDAMIDIGAIEEALPQMQGHQDLSNCSIQIDGVSYFPGILMIADPE